MSNIIQTDSHEFLPKATSINEIMQQCEMIAKSDLVPKDYRGKPNNVFVAMWKAHDLNIPPMQALENIAVINGRASIWGDLVITLIRRHPEFESIEEEIVNADLLDSERATPDIYAVTAVCKLKRRGQPIVVRSFSVRDAKRAGLWQKQGPWSQYPKRMLAMRARSFAIRDCFSDALMGLSMAEEMQDIELSVNEVVTGNEPDAGHEKVKGEVQMPRPKAKAKAKTETKPAEVEDIQEIENNPTPPFDLATPNPKAKEPELVKEEPKESEEPPFSLTEPEPKPEISEEDQNFLANIEAKIEEIENMAELKALFINLDIEKQKLAKPIFTKRRQELGA